MYSKFNEYTQIPYGKGTDEIYIEAYDDDWSADDYIGKTPKTIGTKQPKITVDYLLWLSSH